jgi:putative ABC transport system permease protein
MKAIYRNIKRGKLIYATLFVSLVVAFTAMTLILGFNFNEYAVDSFHINKNRVFRLLSDDPWSENAKFPYITKDAPQYIKSTFPEVVDFCQWNRNGYEKIEVNGNTFFKGMDIFETDQSFFKIFSYKLKEGNVKDALATKSDIILTEASASKFFGDESAIGKSITIIYRNKTLTYTVTGIIESPKLRSHLNFDMLTSIEGKDIRGCTAYLLLKNGTNPSDFEKKLQDHRTEIPFFITGASVNYYLEDLPSIYLSKEVKSKILIYFMITFLILFVAFFNYMNLLVTQLREREKELNIRRIIGGSFYRITGTLVYESATLVIASMAVSFVCAKLVLPLFNKINKTNIGFVDFINLEVLGSLFIVTLFIIMVSFLIIYSYIRHFSAKEPSIKDNSNKFALINTFQFAVSIVLVVCTISIFKQISYIHNKDIGLDRSVVEMRLPPFDGDKSSVLKELLLKNPAIEEVSVCSASPVMEGAMVLYSYEVNGVRKEYSPLFFQGDKNYLRTLGIKLVKGRDFSQVEQQNQNKCIINQAMIRFLDMDSPIGKILPGSEMEIIGIVKDFHWTSIESDIPPSIIAPTNSGANVLVKVSPESQNEAIAYINNSWKEIIPDYPFEYSTIGDSFNMKHEKYDILIRFISFFCLLAIFLSVIGLFARSISIVNRKTKEIGIRKVNGARISEIMVMLNRNLARWVVIAFVIATPIAYTAMNKWLDNFAYKTDLSWWIFALAGVLALGIALLTVSWQSWRAATRNPVESLRYE